jgi:hypothetical protein
VDQQARLPNLAAAQDGDRELAALFRTAQSYSRKATELGKQILAAPVSDSIWLAVMQAAPMPGR